MLSPAGASAHNCFRQPILGTWPTNLDYSLGENESVMLSATNTERSIKSNDSLSVSQLYIPLHVILYYDRNAVYLLHDEAPAPRCPVELKEKKNGKLSLHLRWFCSQLESEPFLTDICSNQKSSLKTPVVSRSVWNGNHNFVSRWARFLISEKSLVLLLVRRFENIQNQLHLVTKLCVWLRKLNPACRCIFTLNPRNFGERSVEKETFSAARDLWSWRGELSHTKQLMPSSTRLISAREEWKELLAKGQRMKCGTLFAQTYIFGSLVKPEATTPRVPRVHQKWSFCTQVPGALWNCVSGCLWVCCVRCSCCIWSDERPCCTEVGFFWCLWAACVLPGRRHRRSAAADWTIIHGIYKYSLSSLMRQAVMSNLSLLYTPQFSIFSNFTFHSSHFCSCKRVHSVGKVPERHAVRVISTYSHLLPTQKCRFRFCNSWKLSRNTKSWHFCASVPTASDPTRHTLV